MIILNFWDMGGFWILKKIYINVPFFGTNGIFVAFFFKFDCATYILSNFMF